MRCKNPLCARPPRKGKHEASAESRSERETDVWMRQVERLGCFPSETTIVHVGDRGADLFPFFTGCRLEERQLQSAARLIRWLGLLSPLAVRLLQWRDLSRRQPECPAHRLLDADLLAVVAAQVGQAPAGMTTEAFWKAVAQIISVYKMCRKDRAEARGTHRRFWVEMTAS